MDNMLGETLKKSRERKGYSLREVENKLNQININYAYTNIKRLEDGDNAKASIKVLAGLCEIYNLDKINILNMAGANIKEEEELEMNKFIDKGALFFNDENISEEDKKKVMEAFQEMFFKSKLGM